MPTAKPRIFITLSEAPYGHLKKLAKERQESLSRIATELVHAGMEALEDEGLSDLSDKRLSGFDMKKAVSFDTVKRQFPAKKRGTRR